MQAWDLTIKQIQEILADAPSDISALSNLSAHLYEVMDNVNWCGFYLTEGSDHLILGPFQGKLACYDIDFGRGVCGTAAQSKTIQLVDNVHEFAGHIACDSASESEIVVPLIKHDICVGVLDIDSPTRARFSQQDADALQNIVTILMNTTFRKRYLF